MDRFRSSKHFKELIIAANACFYATEVENGALKVARKSVKTNCLKLLLVKNAQKNRGNVVV